MSEPVSPADTIRRFIAEREYGTDDGGTVWTLDADEARAALDALLAVGERDKAEIGRLRRLVARAAVKREVLLIKRERDRRKIAQLTEALNALDRAALIYRRSLKEVVEETMNDKVRIDLIRETVSNAISAADYELRRAVLADEEDANGG